MERNSSVAYKNIVLLVILLALTVNMVGFSINSNVDPKEIIRLVLATSRFVILISCFALVNLFSFKLIKLGLNSTNEQINTKEISSTALKMVSVLFY